MQFAVYLTLLLVAGTFSIVSAVSTSVNAAWTNATVQAAPELEIRLTTGDDLLLPKDALLKIQLNEWFTVASDAAVDDTVLEETLDGRWSVTVDTATNALVVQRSGDGSEVSSGTLLRFKLTGITNPTRAGRISVGSMELSTADATLNRTLQLPSMDVQPGVIWNAKLAFSNLLSGRTASLEIHLILAHAFPNDGAVGVYLSYMYGSSSGVTLSSAVGLDGTFAISTQSNVIWIKRNALSGTDSAAMQDVTMRIDGIAHPMLEGPVGPFVRLQAVDGSSKIIDQTDVDTSNSILSKARVVVNHLSLRVNEGDDAGGEYTISLSAPPYGDTALTVSVGDLVSRTKLILDPQSVVFTTSNWSSSATISVTTADDHIVSGILNVESVVAIPHSITSGDSGGTFAIVDEVNVHISENDFPAVLISDRFLAVIEGLRNDSYGISLLSQPSSDVVVQLTPHDPFIETFPEQVTFTASTWSTPKTINVVASTSISTTRTTSKVTHEITSADLNYNNKNDQVFPQNEILVYFEPHELESCVQPCRLGWFPLVNATTGDSQCVGCPLGYFCSGSCSAPVPCPKGTSSNIAAAKLADTCQICPTGMYAHSEGLSTCLVCPAGSSCSDATSSPQPCPAGSYSIAGETQCNECPAGSYNNESSQQECTKCPEGYYCAKGSINPVACATGTYSVDFGASSCGKCPAGFACSDPVIGPLPCLAGTYSLADSLTCSPCPSGQFCLSADQGPQACGAGYYSEQSSTSCKSCPRGYSCSSPTTSVPAACALGTYSSVERATTCRICPAGHSCVDAAQAPTLCQLGSYSVEGDHVCHACPAGSYCPDVYNAPLDCVAGSFSLGNAVVCTPCGAGVKCSANSSPVACTAGYYSTNGSACQLCEAGSYCASIFQPPLKCLQGTYSRSGAVECTKCPNGYSCTVSGDPQACALGQTNNADYSACIPCPKGFECSPLKSTSTACAIGTYSLDGDGQCKSCPKGFQCATTTDAPARCADGTYSSEGAVECLECPAGQYCPQPSSDPITCPPWYYSGKASTTCTACPAGMDCSTPSSVPVACPRGSYSLVTASACSPCPAGSSCANTTTSPTVCDPGSFSAQGQPKCTPCAAGCYCPQSGQTAQLPCLDGTYAEAGATACTPCPAGMQCPVTTQAIKEACPAGTYSLGGQAHCISCPIGHKCPHVDGSQNAVCTPGWFSPGGSVECTICPAGSVCPDPTASPPVPCPAGSYSLIGATTCTACPAGYACPDPTTKLLVPCAKGTYSTGGASVCTPCPAGYTCSFSNSSSVEPCQAGFYSTSGSASCVECPRGYYCDTPNEMPKNCSVGYYSERAATKCLACAPGYECPRSDQLPQPCPVGYYSEGAVANCRSCFPGYKCSLASTSPTPLDDACPMGGYCNPPTTFFLCPAGTYGNTTAGQSIDQACAPCPEGFYCEMGTTPLTKQVCPAGFFCPEGTKRASQYPCPAGTFNPDAGQKFDVCQDCPAGRYCPAGTSDPRTCPQGYYCLEGTRTFNQYPCPAGTYSATTGTINSDQCNECPLGNYCPEASSAPTNCPAGTYNPETGGASVHECLDCPPGWSCPHVGQINYVDRCAKGHYCPGGSVLATDHPCPAGFYTERMDLIRSEDCIICPMRHACPLGTGGETQMMLNCGAGFFCPNGTQNSNQYPCLPGTWSNSTSLSAAVECDICPKGSYCQGGKSFIDGDCSPGHYCPLGTYSSTQFPCPSGTYTANTWLFEPSQCDDCPPGYYCPAGSVAPIPCKAGSYTSLNNTKTVGPTDSWPACITCPAGFFCIEASVNPQPCGKGKFSSSGSKVCSSCEAGYFCNSETTSAVNMRSRALGWLSPGALYGTCYNGTYCPSGSDSEPALETDACPPGYFCPTATPSPIICPAGTYSNFTGQDDMSDCTPTPAGYYSLAGALAPTGVCAPGFYCPLRSTSQTQIPCPARYYLNQTMGQSEEDCALCVSGSYCPIGTAYPITCPAGYYCRTGISSPEPCPIGTYANATGLRTVNDCLLCPPGMYCDSTALTIPRGLCDPGYYCTLGAYTSAPMNYESTLFGVSNRHTGDLCPQGAYCPLGSATPTLCPSGTFNNFTGLEAVGQCVPCPPGDYCETPGLFLPTGSCHPGYYCIGGAAVPTQVETPAGSFSLDGATAPSPCPPGEYNLYSARDKCVVCPAGFYCGLPGTKTPTVCPTGNYCPEGTSLPVKCLPGTFSEVEGLVKLDQCKPCPSGQFCDSYGLSSSSGPCLAGFVCVGGSPVSNPVGQTYGFVCPVANYCPEGSGSAIPCPLGSFRAATGGKSLASCSICPGGEYCDATGLTKPSGVCSPGYYCVSSASTPTPTDGLAGAICPTGSYCPEASSAPIKCIAGTFAAGQGQSVCDECPMGYFCDGVVTSTYVDCPAGHYCPAGTAEVPVPCPIGTFSNDIRLTNVTECKNCTPGAFCESLGLVQPTGPCAAGSYCPPRSESKFGRTAENDAHVCLAGSYCPEGTYLPIPCPSGSYSNDTGLVKAADCVYCDEGAFCTDAGLIQPSGLCDAGYYCKRNNTQSNPSSGIVEVLTSTVDDADLTMYFGGEPCPTGSYCPHGSVSPSFCPEGSYTNVTGSPTCLPCPEGFFCPLGSKDYLTNICPLGHYCPDSTQRATQFPCPPGSFGNRTGLQNLLQCTPAPGGTYIDGYAAVKPTGNCRSGFYCSGGSPTGTPAETTATGGPCLPGTNCPEGSAVPIVCAAGAYCSSTNTDGALPCDEGFYCVQGSYTATPTGQNNSLGIIGDVCKRGHYCPPGTSNPIPCPPGTYSENTQNVNASYCLACPAGFICSTSGIVIPNEKCPPGFICTGGESTATQLCPKGFECPEGSSDKRPCPAGTFADERGLAACKLCPERFYCEIGSTTPVECPQGYYCPLQTPSATKYPCLAGTYGDKPALASSKECAQCPRGKFCSGLPPTDTTSGPCAPGHYCAANATTAKPIDGVTGDLCDGGHICLGGAWLADPIDGITGTICEPGYYCPKGSSSQIRCSKGTFNSVEKQSVCVTCPAGGYCDTNATSPVPCPLRYYCSEGIVDPLFCPDGTYGHEVGLTNATECAPCVAGKFCVAGTITSSCTAGYYCRVQNNQPNPTAKISNVSNADVAWRTELGGPCPAGHYCPEGVLDPIPCPRNSSRLTTYGIDLSDCDLCPAGMTCEDGSNTVPCPAGSYCRYGVSEVPCPAGTYNSVKGKANLEDCLPCEAGKLCSRPGILSLTGYDCPQGNYCPPGSSEPQPCPAGSYRAVKAAKSADDCTKCTAGSYCEAGSILPAVCKDTTYCPEGSGSPLLCPGGSYCPYKTTTPLTCPEGFFCAPSVGSPSICTLGHYCPSGTTAQIPCPLGYIGRPTPLDGAFTSEYSSCEACPPGTFGIDVNRTRCDECLEGYVCLGATNSSYPESRETDRGYPCPPGHYCPAGSSSEMACPSGTYLPTYKASNLSECLLCPENSYQNAVGQPSCLPCSTSAFAGTGATKCACVGSHRAFQMTDGYCICEPGYEFYDQDMILRSDEDGDVDCQPIVYDRCSSSQVRSDDGSCVSASGKACEASCNNRTGTYVASLGVCQCDEQPDLDTVCNKKCRDEATQIQVNSTTGELQLYDPLTGEVTSLAGEDTTSGLVSKVSCTPGSDCQLHSVAVSSSGFSGSYDLPSSIASAASRKRRRLTSDSSSSIANPMVCLPVGSGLLFDLSVPRSYPIYLKDSMLNTNPSFDYGAFRALATKVNANASTVSAFAFSFTEPGTYVFGNSLNAAAQTIVVVMKSGTSCPTEAAIVPLNEKNLITVSAKRRTDDLILAPDWALIVGLLGGLFGVVVAVIAGLYYFRAKSWTNTAVKSISGYRAKSKQVNLAAMHSKGTVAVSTTDTPVGDGVILSTEPTTAPVKQFQLGGQEPTKGNTMEYEADLGRWDEEDLDLRELVDRLQFHHEAVTKSFEDQKGDVKQLMQHLQAEAIELKRLFVNALVASDLMSSSPDAKLDGSITSPKDENEVTSVLPISELSGRPRSRSVAGREKFLLENLERDLQDREQFEQKKATILGSVSEGLHEIEGWGAQLAELTGSIVQEMSSPVDDNAPERTSTNEESCLERTRTVLGDLKTLLGSDPMTQISSSLIHLAEAEKGRREVGNFVLEASQRYFTQRSGDAGAAVPTDSDNAVQRLLALHDDVEKAQNKEDEALFGPLPSLRKFGAALPQVLTTIDDLEASFRRELDAVREEQNPVKERNVQAQMQSRLSKLLKEVAAGAKKVNDKLEKDNARALKIRRGAQQAEDALSKAVGNAKEQWCIADLEQRHQRAAAHAKEVEELQSSIPSPPPSAEEEAAAKYHGDTLFQIKELLVGLTTLLRTSGVPSMAPSDELTVTTLRETTANLPGIRTLAEDKRTIESEAQQSAAEYASALDTSYPELSAVEKERLLDDFAWDLRKIQSSVRVEGTRTQAEVATRQTATEVLREAQKAQIQRREQEDAIVLRAQHDEEVQSLESQFRDEELAIEQEYLKELSNLEMEFGSGGDEGEGDFAEPPEDLFDRFDTSSAGDGDPLPELTEAEGAPLEGIKPRFEVLADDNADIIAQLNDVYAQTWNDRSRILAMEDALRKEQLNERLRRKRDSRKGEAEGMAGILSTDDEGQEILMEAVERKEAVLEDVVRSQGDMEALQEEAVNYAVDTLRKQIEECQALGALDSKSHRIDSKHDRDAVAELKVAARKAAQNEKEKGEDEITRAQSELQKLQSEYDHDFMALRGEIENEKLRLEAKLRDSLSAKRRRRTSGNTSGEDTTVDEEAIGGDGSSPEEEFEAQLTAFVDQAIEGLRDKHFELQQKLEAQKVQTAVAVAVANAQLAYLDDLDSDNKSLLGPTMTTDRVETPRSHLHLTEEFLEVLANHIPIHIAQQTQQAFDKLHADYLVACTKRRQELEADAARRKAKLVEKMNRRRHEKELDKSEKQVNSQSTGSQLELLGEQERKDLLAIDQELRTSILALDENERQTGKRLAKMVALALHKSGKSVEDKLRECRQQHELAVSKLKPDDEEGFKSLSNAVIHVLDVLEDDAIQSEKTATQSREAIESEIERLKDESANALAALGHALDSEKRRQKQRLQQRMAQRRDQQHSQLPASSSPKEVEDMNDVMAKQEVIEKQRLEDQLESQAQLAFAEERSKQREHEDQLLEQLRDACVAEAAAIATKDAIDQARGEFTSSGASNGDELATLVRLWKARKTRKPSMKEATVMIARKRSVVERLAAFAVPSVVVEGTSVGIDEDNVVADTMAASMEQQIKALSADRLRAWQQRQQELQDDEVRRKADLEDRLRRKREAKLHIDSDGAPDALPGDREAEELERQQLEAAAIERKFTIEAEIDADLEHLAAAVQTAGAQSTADVETLLAACHANFEAETVALRDALKAQRKAQQNALSQLLSRKRHEKLQALESGGRNPDPSELDALGESLKLEEEAELRIMFEDENRQLSVLHDRLRDEVGAAFAEAERKAKLRSDSASNRLAVKEDDLDGIHRDHEEGTRSLREALSVEQRRQQDKLLERMARRRAERLAGLKQEHPSDLTEEVVQKVMKVLENEHERERVRLDVAISEQTTQALRDLEEKTLAKEAHLHLETRRLRGEAEAAEAARKALAAAHCAESDRVTREFYACLGDESSDIDGLQAQDRRRRLVQRLAAKRAQKTRSLMPSSPNNADSAQQKADACSSVAAVLSSETEVAVVDDLEHELQRLHDEHDREWGALKARIDDETRLRKSQLAERLQRKRQAIRDNTTLPTNEKQRAEAALDREEERENLAIESAAALATRSLVLTMQHVREQTAEALAEGISSSSDELDALLESTRKQHDEAQRKLRETLEMERRKQEQLLQERLRLRRAARKEGTEPLPKHGTEEEEEAELKQELDDTLSAQENQAWTALHELEKQEVEAVLAPLEAATGQRLDAAEFAERKAREELDRLAAEHDRHLADLRRNLDAEKQRQQLTLRDKLRRKRDQRQADGTALSGEEDKEEEQQAMEKLETAFEANLSSIQADARDSYREKETELLAQVCTLSANRAAQEAALTLFDAARLEAERVRAEYEAAFTVKRQEVEADRVLCRDEMSRRLADRRQKRRQERAEQQEPRDDNGSNGENGARNEGRKPQPSEQAYKEVEDDGSVDREISSVQAAHARGVKLRSEQLDAETAARKAALAARLEHKRRAAESNSDSGKLCAVSAEIEAALIQEEQQELMAIEQDRAAKEAELETEATREKDRLATSLREAEENGTADIERQLVACKIAHEAESARLEEALRAERVRQELALKQRLAVKRQRRAVDGTDVKDEDGSEVQTTEGQEVEAAQIELDEQERAARQQLADRHQRELEDVARKLEQETETQRRAAFDLQAAAERELKRLEEEHSRERLALQEALQADHQKREAQLREKLAKRRAARQAKGGQNELQDDVVHAEDEVEMAALQEELMQERAAALAQERERQEVAMRKAAVELEDAAAASAKASAASRQAQAEAARVAAEFDKHRGETQKLQQAETVQSKSKLADRLAEKKRKQQLKQQQAEKDQQGTSSADAAKQAHDEAERLRLEAQIEAQLVACRETHDAESAKLRESLQAERERQERALQERIAWRKEKRAQADVKAPSKVDMKAAEEDEQRQQQEEEAALAAALAIQEREAWEAIQRKQEEDLRVLQERKQQQERERAERQQQLAKHEMDRLQEEHERELRALTASLAQEQARQEEKLQQRIAQRRVRKQRQEEEAAITEAKNQQVNTNAEEEARLAVEREKAVALAQAQAQAEAEAEEKERQAIAARLAKKLEEERARQRREKEELEARLAREAEAEAAKRAAALALQLQQQATETADKMAHEFDTNLRELRETHSADGAAQKARLESRIAAKKARKLRELEEKRELERQRLQTRQQQEAAEALKAEKEREEALAEAARKAAISVVEEMVAEQPTTTLSPAEEKAGAMIQAARQQQHDVAAVQQLFTYGLVPLKLSLLGAVELVVGARHERELSTQLAELAAKTIESVRRGLQRVTQQKAARKAQALQEISSRQSNDVAEQGEDWIKAKTDRVLDQIDLEFEVELREAERVATEEGEDAKRQAEKLLREQQMHEVAYLLAHFDAQHTAALASTPSYAQPLQQQQPLQPMTNAAQREAEDLVAELRARLELEADERRRELELEKHSELERVAREERDQLAQVEARVATLQAEERDAMTQMLTSRLQTIPASKAKLRDSAEREHTKQLQRLTLLLEGRGQQQKARVRARIAEQKVLIEDEFRRKAHIIIAVMNQRLAQEKAALRQKQELVTLAPGDTTPKDPIQDGGTASSTLSAELVKRLEDVLEERLAKIEALVAAFKQPEQEVNPAVTNTPKQSDPEEEINKLIAYRFEFAKAVAAGCRHGKPIIGKDGFLTPSSFGVLDANVLDIAKLQPVSVNKLDERMRARYDFANLLLQTASTKEDSAMALKVVEGFGRGNNGDGDYASFASDQSDRGGKGILYLSLAALHELSTGQLSVVVLHALTQARAHTSDLTEPQFISNLYALLVRCYQGLFTHVLNQERVTSAESASGHPEKRKSLSSREGVKSVGGSDKGASGQWQTRLREMEGFLTHMETQNAASASSLAIQRSQSSRLRLLSKPRDQDSTVVSSETLPGIISTDLWRQEHAQLLQEKLDTAEKLYLQVLRQHEQQTQTVEYWQDLLAEQRDAEYEEDAFDEEGEDESGDKHKNDEDAAERQRQREAQAQEAQRELDQAMQTLDVTRKERDELFAQCQQLRDQLTELRSSRAER